MTAPADAAANSNLLELASVEIERLAGSDIAEDRFFEEFLAQLRSAAQAEAGAVWLLSQNPDSGHRNLNTLEETTDSTDSTD